MTSLGIWILVTFLILFVIIAGKSGLTRAVSMLPILIIAAIILPILLKISFYALIVIIPIAILFRLLGTKNTTTYKKRRYYNTNEDFEEYYKKTSENRRSTDQTNHIYGKFRYCKILEVSETATKEEVKHAYRDLVKLHHPDKYMNAEENIKKYHEDKIKEINEAYEKLMKYYE